MTEPGANATWREQAACRLKSHWLFKMVGTMLIMAGFMAVYLTLLWHPQFPVTAIPWTPIDYLIGFHAWAIIPYASLWFYISLVPALLLLRHELAPYLSAVVMLSLIGFTIFFFWPTTVVQPDIDWRLYPLSRF